jgi:hypothetical protein
MVQNKFRFRQPNYTNIGTIIDCNGDSSLSVHIFPRTRTIIPAPHLRRKTIHCAPYGAFVFFKFYFGFQYCLIFGDAAGLYLGGYPQVDLAVGEYFGGDKTGFVHGRKYALVEKCVCCLDIHKISQKSKVKSQKSKVKSQKSKVKSQKGMFLMRIGI